MVYTAHIGEETKRFNLGQGVPIALRLFSPDIYLMRRVRTGVVLNEPLKSKLLVKGLDNLEVIPHGVNVEEYGNVSEEAMRNVQDKYGTTGKTMVMFAGTVTPRKGVETLLQAAEKLVNHLGHRDMLFLIVGNLSIDEQFSSQAKEFIISHHLEDNVTLTGFVSPDELKALYNSCDLFVLPSFEEGFGIVLTEAMASGKPLIGTNVGGIPMQVIDEWNGYLVEPGNEEQLAEKIWCLISCTADREVMGRNSKSLAERKFHWKKIAVRYSQIYQHMTTP